MKTTTSPVVLRDFRDDDEITKTIEEKTSKITYYYSVYNKNNSNNNSNSNNDNNNNNIYIYNIIRFVYRTSLTTWSGCNSIPTSATAEPVKIISKTAFGREI